MTMIAFKNSLSILTLLFFSLSTSFAQTKGLASYYGDAFHGSKTANGEVYDRNELTGAHRTLPFGTYVKVTRTDNKKSVIIKINDRGPFIQERVVDISKKAAEVIGLTRDGITQVILEKVNGPASDAPAAKTTVAKAPETEPLTPAPAAAKEKSTDIQLPKSATKPTPKPKNEKPVVKAKPAKKLKPLTSKTYNSYDLYKIQVMRPEKEGFGVQVASFGEYENVMKRIAELQERHFKNILISVEKGGSTGTVYKIIMGPFEDQATAAAYKKSLSKKHKIKGFTVNLGEISY